MREDDPLIKKASRIAGVVGFICSWILYGVIVNSWSPPEYNINGYGINVYPRIAGSAGAAVPFCVTGAYLIATFGYYIPRDLARYFLQVIGYKRWAATFEEDWTPDGKDKYHWFTVLLHIADFGPGTIKKFITRWHSRG